MAAFRNNLVATTTASRIQSGDEPREFQALVQKLTVGTQHALRHSVLRSNGVDRMEHELDAWHKSRWWLLILSGLVATIVAPYQFVFRFLPLVSKERLLRGPRALNWMLGILVHPIVEEVREGVTSPAALDTINNISEFLPNPQGWREKFVYHLFRQPDGQAVTNRLKKVYAAILKELTILGKTGRKIHIVSLACGSAQAMIEAIEIYLSSHPQVELELWLVDLNKSALQKAVQMAEDRGIAHLVNVRCQRFQEFLDGFPDGHWDIIEMVGFLDYASDSAVVRYCSRVRRAIRKGGLFIGAMIGPGSFDFVVRWLVNWPLLIRRTPEEYRDLVIQAWPEVETVIDPEPHRIHTLSYCRKLSD